MAGHEQSGYDLGSGKKSLAVVLQDSSGTEVAPLTAAQALTLYALPANFINAPITSDITHTTTVTLFAAQGGTTRSYINSIVIQNANASQGGWVQILDATTNIHNVYCAPGGGGEALTLVTPLRGGANASVFLKCETTGMNVRANVAGYKGA